MTVQSVTTEWSLALIWECFYTEVLVPLERLSSYIYQRWLFRYYLVGVSIAVACRMFTLSYYCFWACDLPECVTLATVSLFTLIVNSSFSLSFPLSFLPTKTVFRNYSWSGSRRPFPRNYSIEGPTIQWWACRHLGFLATLFMVHPISLRPLVHDTTLGIF